MVVAAAATIVTATPGIIAIVAAVVVASAISIVAAVAALVIAVIGLRICHDRGLIASLVIIAVVATGARRERGADGEPGNTSDHRGSAIAAATIAAVALRLSGRSHCERRSAECDGERYLLELGNHDLCPRG